MISFRKATKTDIPALLQINLSSFEANASYDDYIDMDWIHTDDARTLFSDAVSKKDYCAILAQDDELPIGFILLGPKSMAYRTVRVVELEILAVLPNYRSKGIGKQLVEEAKIWAKQHGYQTMYVSSYIKNDRAIDFYQREKFALFDMGLEILL